MGAALKFKRQTVPRQEGELARFKVVSGPDFGVVYIIKNQSALIGRGENCDVLIADLKASRAHAVLKLTPQGWIISDQGSANGITINKKNTRKGAVKSGDIIGLGETLLELNTQDQPDQLLLAPPPSLQEIEKNQQQVELQKKRVQNLGKIGHGVAGANLSNKKQGDKKPNPILILLIAGAAAYFLLFETDNKPKPKSRVAPKTPPTENVRDLSTLMPKNENLAAVKTAEQFYRLGFREFRAKNYIRAQRQFETVLQIYPSHPLAQLYLENCKQAIKEEVALHLDRGKKHTGSGKLKTALWHYEVVMRLLESDQNNPDYWSAREQWELVKKQLGEDISTLPVDQVYFGEPEVGGAQ